MFSFASNLYAEFENGLLRFEVKRVKGFDLFFFLIPFLEQFHGCQNLSKDFLLRGQAQDSVNLTFRDFKGSRCTVKVFNVLVLNGLKKN